LSAPKQGCSGWPNRLAMSAKLAKTLGYICSTAWTVFRCVQSGCAGDWVAPRFATATPGLLVSCSFAQRPPAGGKLIPVLPLAIRASSERFQKDFIKISPTSPRPERSSGASCLRREGLRSHRYTAEVAESPIGFEHLLNSTTRRAASPVRVSHKPGHSMTDRQFRGNPCTPLLVFSPSRLRRVNRGFGPPLQD
jgi:hypothetical protein